MPRAADRPVVLEPVIAPWIAPAIGRIVHVVNLQMCLPAIVVGVYDARDPASMLDVGVFGAAYDLLQRVPHTSAKTDEMWHWEWPPR